MTKRKRQLEESNNAAWQAANIAIREVDLTQLSDDEKKLVFTMNDKDKKCVAFFFFFVSNGCAVGSFSAFSPTS